MEHSYLMGKRSSKSCLVLLAIGFISILADAYGERKVYIVHLGKRKHEDPEFVTASHHQMLESLLGSKEDAHKSIVYSYRHGFSAFAATLTDSQAKKIAEFPEGIDVIPNRIRKVQTTRTWDYLGLSSGSASKGLLHGTNMGSDSIIGIVDTGVWPESKSYNDKGFGPIPNRWKGKCDNGEQFNATIHCNKKLIGARYYMDGLLKAIGHFNKTTVPDYMSPRDANGHGTHVSSTAGGSFVSNVSYFGLAGGTVRGGAPLARIAIYKACWNTGGGRCTTADVWKAFDDAIHDGVDVLSLSISFGLPISSEVDTRDTDAVAFHAVTKGIPVIYSAGNKGPDSQTVSNVAPWTVTVAATTLDRSFPAPITLGNNLTLMGDALYTGPEVGFTGLIAQGDDVSVKGKIVLVFKEQAETLSILGEKRKEGPAGLIFARTPDDLVSRAPDDFPLVFVDYEIGTRISVYIRSTRSPTVRISRSKTFTGRPATTKVARFSCRGPNSLSPAILKIGPTAEYAFHKIQPDIAAPGVNILAAVSPANTLTDDGFAFKTGTSMSTPVIAGIVALLKALHPHWSPAAIKSAMVTTAWRTDPSTGEPIFAEGSPKKLADPFDYGGGLVNPEKAAQPGLVYDMLTDDYVHYLCSVGYNDSSISQLVGQRTICPTPRPSVLDVNLPSITIPDLKGEVTLTRTVTNVGPVNSVYKAVVEPPLGVNVVVKPQKLVFNSAIKKITFSVRVSTTHKVNNGYYFGSLTWTDGPHYVRIPLSVRTQIIQYFN